jgi:predicted permease
VVAAAITLATGVLFGLVPALDASRFDVAGSLKDRGGEPVRRQRFRSGFVIAQIAASAVLLALTVQLATTLRRAARVDIGFEPNGVHAVSVDLEVLGYDDERARRFAADLEERARRIAGVTAVGTIDLIPLTLSEQGTGISIDGRDPVVGVGRFFTSLARVSPGYFETVGIPIVRGRGLAGSDRTGAPLALVINETLARRIWPNEDPIGKVVRYGDFDEGPLATVVGVARDAKYQSLGDEGVGMIYLAVAQETPRSLSLLVRSAAPAAVMAPALREIVRQLDPALPVSHNAPLSRLVGIALLPNRISAWLAGGFGLVGMVLVGVGLFGVLSYTVTRRRREFGIRIALGAPGRQVRGLVLRQGATLAAIGLATGLAGAVGLSRLIGNLLFGMARLGFETTAAVAITLGAVCLLASYLPARRATRTQPLEVLRHD